MSEPATTKRPPRDEMDELLDLLVRAGKEMLEKHGEFLPFAAVIGSNGKPRVVAGYTGRKRPQSIETLELIRAGLRLSAEKGKIRASGICVDVRMHQPDQSTEAMQILLEHVAGESVTVFVPYERKEHGEVRLGDLSAVPGERRVFL